MAYATLYDLQTYLGIDEAADDTLLTSLLTRAQAAIDSRTRRTFEAAADSVRRFDERAIGGRLLYLDADLCAITSVVNGDGVTIAGAEYTTEPRNAQPWHALVLRPSSPYAWDGVTGDIAITGRWAYSTNAPQDIAHACIRLAAWMYRQKDNTGGDLPMIAGDVTILPSRLPADVAELLDPYVRRLV